MLLYFNNFIIKMIFLHASNSSNSKNKKYSQHFVKRFAAANVETQISYLDSTCEWEIKFHMLLQEYEFIIKSNAIHLPNFFFRYSLSF